MKKVGKVNISVVNRGDLNKILLLCLVIYWGDFNEPLLLIWDVFGGLGVVFSNRAC